MSNCCRVSGLRLSTKTSHFVGFSWRPTADEGSFSRIARAAVRHSLAGPTIVMSSRYSLTPRLLHMVLDKRFSQRVLDILRCGKLIALSKSPDKIDVRPITISDTLLKLLGGVCMSTCTATLPSFQRGVRHPGGCAQVVHEVQAELDAVNGTSIMSSSGVRQGDLPASWLFADAFTAAVTSILLEAGLDEATIIRCVRLYLDHILLRLPVKNNNFLSPKGREKEFSLCLIHVLGMVVTPLGC